MEKGVAFIVDDNSDSTSVVRMRPNKSWHGGDDPGGVMDMVFLVEEIVFIQTNRTRMTQISRIHKGHKEREIIDKGDFQRTSLNILADIISHILWN